MKNPANTGGAVQLVGEHPPYSKNLPKNKADPISVFMGTLPDEEHLWRMRIHGCREVATSRAATFESPMARQLAWMVCDVSTQAVFDRSFSTEELEAIAHFLRQLLNASDLAERLMEPCDGMV